MLFYSLLRVFCARPRIYVRERLPQQGGHSTRVIPGQCARNIVDDLRMSPIVTPPSPQVSGTGRNKLYPGLFCQTLDRQRIPWYTYYKNTAAEDLLLGRKRIVRLPENFRRRREGLWKSSGEPYLLFYSALCSFLRLPPWRSLATVPQHPPQPGSGQESGTENEGDNPGGETGNEDNPGGETGNEDNPGGIEDMTMQERYEALCAAVDAANGIIP